jgi:uncharacterized protein YlzI (FlbEa/FlbD family)
MTNNVLLHRSGTGGEIWINRAHIIYCELSKEDDSTTIRLMNDASIGVKESPEQVMSQY